MNWISVNKIFDFIVDRLNLYKEKISCFSKVSFFSIDYIFLDLSDVCNVYNYFRFKELKSINSNLWKILKKLQIIHFKRNKLKH